MSAPKFKNTPNQIPNIYPLNYGPQTDPNQTPYEKFRLINNVAADVPASQSASSLLAQYPTSKVTYNAKSAQSYIPEDILSKLGQATTNFSNYKPEKIDVAKTSSMPIEYYQKQVEDLSQPLVQQYDRSRATMKGDQAARGTMYDSQGKNDIIEKIDEPFFKELGNITRGVQIQRMQDERANEQDYNTRLQQEAMDRRSIGLEGLTRGTSAISDVSKMYGSLGQAESDMARQTALQQAGLDVNMINSLLGYGADRYRSEADLFGNVYGTDVQAGTDYNKNQMDSIMRLLELEGYQETPQEQLWQEFASNLGYSPYVLSERQKAEDKIKSDQDKAKHPNWYSNSNPNGYRR